MQRQLIKFTKMHGLGNDFLIIDAIHQTVRSEQLPIVELANRYTGVGFDQLLLIQPSQMSDYFCRIFNADGSEAEQCGNGLRCIARFLHEQGLHRDNNLTIETIGGVFHANIHDYNNICIEMGKPEIANLREDLKVANENIQASILSIGNPHAIINVINIGEVPVQTLGKAISTQQIFPRGANVGFMQIITPTHIRLRTYERGIGETYACGSNACAAVAAGIMQGALATTVTVEFDYGNLKIIWEGEDKPLHMCGPASFVFSGETWL